MSDGWRYLGLEEGGVGGGDLLEQSDGVLVAILLHGDRRQEEASLLQVA